MPLLVKSQDASFISALTSAIRAIESEAGVPRAVRESCEKIRTIATTPQLRRAAVLAGAVPALSEAMKELLGEPSALHMPLCTLRLVLDSDDAPADHPGCCDVLMQVCCPTHC
jgi:hypothetical protein